jgi:hypothetical protein
MGAGLIDIPYATCSGSSMTGLTVAPEHPVAVNVPLSFTTRSGVYSFYLVDGQPIIIPDNSDIESLVGVKEIWPGHIVVICFVFQYNDPMARF